MSNKWLISVMVIMVVGVLLTGALLYASSPKSAGDIYVDSLTPVLAEFMPGQTAAKAQVAQALYLRDIKDILTKIEKRMEKNEK